MNRIRKGRREREVIIENASIGSSADSESDGESYEKLQQEAFGNIKYYEEKRRKSEEEIIQREENKKWIEEEEKIGRVGTPSPDQEKG